MSYVRISNRPDFVIARTPLYGLLASLDMERLSTAKPDTVTPDTFHSTDRIGAGSSRLVFSPKSSAPNPFRSPG